MTEPLAQLSMEIAEALAALGAGNDAGVTGSLQQLVDTAYDVLPSTTAVSVTTRIDGEVFTAVSSAPVALELDERQYDAGAGPCTEAMTSGTTVHSPDLRVESRWSDWTPVAVAAGIGSMRSVSLMARDGAHLGALNCYGSTALAYAGSGVDRLAGLLGTHASTLLGNMSTVGASRELADQLKEAMVSRATIEQAKGVLMGRLGIDSDLAFDYLVRMSQNSHRKLREVASGVVATAIRGPGSDPQS